MELDGATTSQDGDFELTAEMMIHGALDDESTLAEEEELQDQDSNELDDLQAEGEIPLEQLLARYRYGGESSGVSSGGGDGVRGGDGDSSSELPTEQSNVLTGQTGHEPDQPALQSHSDHYNPLHLSEQPVEQTRDTSGPPPLLELKQDKLPDDHSDDEVVYLRDNLNHSHALDEGNGDGVISDGHHDGGLLGKRPLDPVYNDVLLSSKRPALMGEINEDEPQQNQNISTSPITMATNSSHWIRSGRLRRDLPERRRILAEGGYVDAYFSSFLEDSEGSDDEYVPKEDWKQEIKVGSPYQAVIPDRPLSQPPSASYRVMPSGNLTWRPEESSEEIVSQYLKALSQSVTDVNCDSERDNEQALEVLQQCDHDVDKALELIQRDGVHKSGMDPWSESECHSFEEGLRMLGKDFFRIQKQVSSRSVKELIEFYYIWKKSERCDLLIQQYGKIGRRKVVVPPGHVSDFMNKYMDIYSTDTPDIHYGATTISAEAKRESI